MFSPACPNKAKKLLDKYFYKKMDKPQQQIVGFLVIISTPIQPGHNDRNNLWHIWSV
jgi:hypothetical protein